MRAALEGLPGVTEAEVELRTGTATVRATGLTAEEAAEAVRGRVMLAWARAVLARVPLLGRGDS